MSTANTIPNTDTEQLLGQRLDVIDRALMGILSRNDRIAMVSQVESRIRELVAVGTEDEANRQATRERLRIAENNVDRDLENTPDMNLGLAPSSRLGAGRGNWARTRRRLSRIALAAGVLGISALVLLFMTPVVYFIVAMVGDEIFAISLLGVHTVAVAVGGTAAVALGIAALVRIRRRTRNLTGHGWAITGLCTGPMPMLAGCTVGLVVGLQLLSSTLVREARVDGVASSAVLLNDGAPSPLDVPPSETTQPSNRYEVESNQSESEKRDTSPAPLETKYEAPVTEPGRPPAIPSDGEPLPSVAPQPLNPPPAGAEEVPLPRSAPAPAAVPSDFQPSTEQPSNAPTD